MEKAKHLLEKLPLTDWLAVERTKLASERTFLAYFRSALVLLGSGVTVLKVEYFNEFVDYSWLPIAASPIVFIVGLIRFTRINKRIKKQYSKIIVKT